MKDDLLPVLSGVTADDCSWTVLAGFESDDVVVTLIRRLNGDRKATSGFKGPRTTGLPVRAWIGRADGLPSFVMVRAAPSVRSIVGFDAAGVEHPLAMSQVIEAFGLRFGVVAFPERMPIVRIVYNDAGTRDQLELRRPGPSTPGKGSGWRAT